MWVTSVTGVEDELNDNAKVVKVVKYAAVYQSQYLYHRTSPFRWSSCFDACLTTRMIGPFSQSQPSHSLMLTSILRNPIWDGVIDYLMTQCVDRLPITRLLLQVSSSLKEVLLPQQLLSPNFPTHCANIEHRL